MSVFTVIAVQISDFKNSILNYLMILKSVFNFRTSSK